MTADLELPAACVVTDVPPTGADTAPLVIEGDVTRVIEIDPYPSSPTLLGGCTGFTGRYVTDPDEIAAIAHRVRGAKPC